MFYFKRDGTREEVTKNESGYIPVEDKLLLLPDEVSEKAGLIHKPDVARAQEQMAQVRALLVAIGGNCFEDWGDPHPKVFGRVMVCKYAGILKVPGADGREYQICTDRDITAIIETDIEPEELEFLGTRKPLSKATPETGRIIT
jgi:co-chaperonin GroES (HSP10)